MFLVLQIINNILFRQYYTNTDRVVVGSKKYLHENKILFCVEERYFCYRPQHGQYLFSYSETALHVPVLFFLKKFKHWHWLGMASYRKIHVSLHQLFLAHWTCSFTHVHTPYQSCHPYSLPLLKPSWVPGVGYIQVRSMNLGFRLFYCHAGRIQALNADATSTSRHGNTYMFRILQ